MISKSLATQISRQLAKKGSGTMITGSFTDLINAWKDYKTTHEVETTKRTQIAADRDVRLAAIQAQADVFENLIQNTFGERAHNFDQFFALLKDGFNSSDDRKINAALTMIVEQIKVNPMAQAVQMMQQINDPNVKCIDI
jgi:hypothetical protein